MFTDNSINFFILGAYFAHLVVFNNRVIAIVVIGKNIRCKELLPTDEVMMKLA